MRTVLTAIFLLLLVTVGPRELFGRLTQSIWSAWGHVGGALDSIEPPAVAPLKEANNILQARLSRQQSAREAVATARVEREQAGKALETLVRKRDASIGVTRVLAQDLQRADRAKAPKVKLSTELAECSLPGEMTRAQARDVLQAACRKVRYLEDRVSAQRRTLALAESLTQDWEGRLIKLEAGIGEDRQGVDTLRGLKSDRDARERFDRLRDRAEGVGDPEQDQDKVGRIVAREMARTGFDASEATTAPTGLCDRAVEQYIAKQDVARLVAELTPSTTAP